MRILAIETSSRRGSVALLDSSLMESVAGRLTAEQAAAPDLSEPWLVQASHEVPNAHGEQLLPLLERCLDLMGWKPADIERVAVGFGPGSFTGLRVGIALAQGIALGLGCPLVGISSLAALAAAAISPSSKPRAVLLDARRNEFFAQVFRASGEPLSEPLVLPAAEAIARLRQLCVQEPLNAEEPQGDCEPLWLGEASEALGDCPAFIVGAALPPAWAVAQLALATTPKPFEPLYIRPADAIKPKLPPSPFG